MDKEIKELNEIGAKIIPYEYLQCGFFGEHSFPDPLNNESPRQVELEKWLDAVGCDFIGENWECRECYTGLTPEQHQSKMRQIFITAGL